VKRVLVADGLQAVGVDALRKHGLDVEVVGSLGERELVERIGEYEGLIVRSATKVTRPVIEAGRGPQGICRAGAGGVYSDDGCDTNRVEGVISSSGGQTVSWY